MVSYSRRPVRRASFALRRARESKTSAVTGVRSTRKSQDRTALVPNSIHQTETSTALGPLRTDQSCQGNAKFHASGFIFFLQWVGIDGGFLPIACFDLLNRICSPEDTWVDQCRGAFSIQLCYRFCPLQLAWSILTVSTTRCNSTNF